MIVEVDLTGRSPRPRLAQGGDLSGLRIRALTVDGESAWRELADGLSGFAEVEPESTRVSSTALGKLASDRPDGEAWQAIISRLPTEGDDLLPAAVEWEVEAAIEQADFRHVLGHYATGVAVITADWTSGPVGMACNSLTSVSLDPPLISFCPGKTSETWPQLRGAGRFVVNVMHRDHGELARRFALKGTDRFAGVAHHQRRCGPALDDALAWVDCVLDAEHDAGDHTIVVGRVVGLEAESELEPLVFFRGRYGTFAEPLLPPG